MKKICLLLLLSLAPTIWACCPSFPPSYISDLDSAFSENINIPMELQLLAKEYHLTEHTNFPAGYSSTAKADLSDFTQSAKTLGIDSKIADYQHYSTAIRTASEKDPQPPALPPAMQEFILYLQGVQETKNDPDLLEPKAWINLLNLPPEQRHYRTVWTHYMLGNLATYHKNPDLATSHYRACRQAVRDGFPDSLGLANSSFKQEFRAQTNLVDYIQCGVQAMSYYRTYRNKKKNMTIVFTNFKPSFAIPNSPSTRWLKVHLHSKSPPSFFVAHQLHSVKNYSNN